mmetsp:Transcript_7602/g.11390  ORF Transcript_7602/g.11390 Transcript_7602/m.11390 type:complete len:634 (-) Transcript_7602:183-2084(-)|eukprot:CAMPEP_0171456788 /NCGR_PEP_ID=MMETSP0945-20130129/3127_1 /TAXON_ID=109269 /ORGANISM="Vaucheria litorea, Strain CCMP2940" /LENGTH=633 /DNA_ID=CAMNT_0011982267 /DNA_START=93 /DNA_END=1994 /DNA_ORIENTATION=+
MTSASLLVAPKLDIESKFSRNYDPEEDPQQSLYSDLKKEFKSASDQLEKSNNPNIIRTSPTTNKPAPVVVSSGERKVGGSRKVVCEGEDCSKTPSYGFEHDRRRRRCSQHKDEGMIYLKRRKCSHENCEKLSSYGRLGGPARFCLTHKSPEMVDLVNRRCEMEGCNRRPVFALPGQKARMCSDHRIMNMMDVVNQRCMWGQCGQLARYGLPGERARCCATHRTDGMLKKKGKLNTSANLSRNDCPKDPTFQSMYTEQMNPNGYKFVPTLSLNSATSASLNNIEPKRPLGLIYNNDLGWPTPHSYTMDQMSNGMPEHERSHMFFRNSQMAASSSSYPIYKGQPSYINPTIQSQNNLFQHQLHNIRSVPQYCPSNIVASNNLTMINDSMQNVRYQDQMRCGTNVQSYNPNKSSGMYYSGSEIRKMSNMQAQHGNADYHWDHNSIINMYGIQAKNVGNNVLPIYIPNPPGYHLPGNVQSQNKGNISPSYLHSSSAMAQKAIDLQRIKYQQSLHLQAVQKQQKCMSEQCNNNISSFNKSLFAKEECVLNTANLSAQNMSSSDLGIPLMPPQIFSNSIILPSCSVLLEQIGGDEGGNNTTNHRQLKRNISLEDGLESPPRSKKAAMSFEGEANQIYSS